MSLALKYRPKTFEEVVEQNIVTTILNKVITENKFKNCMLLAGPSGCGKTTCARIIANMINKNVGEPIEVDAASQNSVDNVRAIIEAADQRALVGEYKIFIIDECHMLSNAAWNAFLKTIEEPPKYTIFIFCTTEPNKIPTTILNRVQRYNLAKISMAGIKARLDYVCQQEGFTNYTDTCDLISKVSQGGMRDALAYLDQIADYSTDLNVEVAKKVIGGLSYETMFRLTWAIKNKDEQSLFSIIDNLYNEGQDLKLFVNLYLEFILDLNKYILFKDIGITAIPAYMAAENNPIVQYTINMEDNLAYFNKIATGLLDIKAAIKNDTSYKSTVTIMLLKLMES